MPPHPSPAADSPRTFLPDSPRPRLTPPPRTLARALLRKAGADLLRYAGHATWRLRQPSERGAYLEAPPVPATTDCWYTAADGWRAPLRVIATAGAGEPVVLAHAAGLGVGALCAGALASSLARAGFRVYLLQHRGDRDAVAPSGPTVGDFDAILERDLPAAIAAACADAGYPRVHWVGHGLGGQLGLAAATRDERLATVTAIAAPVAPVRRASEARGAAAAARLLPADWALPLRWIARGTAPFLGPEALGAGWCTGATPGARARGVAHYAVEDARLDLLAQLAAWQRDGAWTSRGGVLDYASTLATAAAPLHVIAGDDDPLCPWVAASAATAAWGGADRTETRLSGYGHLDPLLANDAPTRAHDPLIAWLDARRRAAWEPGFHPAPAAGVTGPAGAACSTRSATSASPSP